MPFEGTLEPKSISLLLVYRVTVQEKPEPGQSEL